MASARFSEALVVAVIEEKEGAGSAQYIEFKVYRSSTDPDLILGSWRFAVGSPVETVIAESRLGASVDIEFPYVLDCADQNGIPFVWVNDPDELFLPFIRR
jgi:hypothetical protein